jgi:RNA polymerase sigma-70 factor (ECF subfamily)
MDRLTPDGFARRFEGCAQALWCVAAAIVGDRHQAEDVLQEAAIVALKRLAEFDPSSAFLAWMGQIVRYVALNHARRRARARELSLEPGTAGSRPGANSLAGACVSSRGDIAPGQESFDDRLLAALRGLDGTARACLLLRVVLDMPYREIARILDIPEGTAASHVHRARHALAERLSRDACAAGESS